MKIWYENTRPVEDPETKPFFNRLRKNFKRVCREGTEVDIKCPEVGTKEFRHVMQGYPYYQFLRDIEMVEGLRQAQEEGYDAGIIGCYEDPGLNVLRAIVDIPIVGVGEASLIIGQAYGVVGLVYLPMAGMVKGRPIFSTQQRGAMKVDTVTRVFNLSPEEIQEYDANEPSRIVEDFIKVGRQLINDGAKALVSAVTMLAATITSEGVTEVDRVPVIDCTITAAKLAELLVGLKEAGLWKSRKTISDEVISGLRNVYYYGKKSR